MSLADKNRKKYDILLEWISRYINAFSDIKQINQQIFFIKTKW